MTERIEVTPDPAIELEVREHQLAVLLATMAFTAAELKALDHVVQIPSDAVADMLEMLISNCGLDGMLKEIEMHYDEDGEEPL